MIDISKSIQSKSDQLNADDLIGVDLIALIDDINYDESRTDQPLWLYYKGCQNKPWKPCKSMRRVLVALWGFDASLYIGKTLKLYRDDKVKWAGEEVGGIRIKEMSGIEKAVTLKIQATRGKKAIIQVKPLVNENKEKEKKANEWAEGLINAIFEAKNIEDLTNLQNISQRHIEKAKVSFPKIAEKVNDAFKAQSQELIKLEEGAVNE